MRSFLVIATLTWAGLWRTPDQLGFHFFRQARFEDAASAFQDPDWRGIALYRTGAFREASRAFSQSNTPEARFNQGNAEVMLGHYDAAVLLYDQALAMRPDWTEARENREVAAARARLLERKGGEMTGGMLAADDIVFDPDAPESGPPDAPPEDAAPSAAEIQALWLRRVQSRPADFLRIKFAYQNAVAASDTP